MSIETELKYVQYLRHETDTYNRSAQDSEVLKALKELNNNELAPFKGTFNTVDKYGNTPLHITIIKDDLKLQLEIVKYLLKKKEVKVNARNTIGQTPIYNAARTGKLLVVKSLLKHGAVVNIQDRMGYSPLHFAMSHPNIAHLLIQKGADIDVKNYNLFTPLHYAVHALNLESVCMLLYYNCDATVANISRNTAFIEALLWDHEAIQEVLFEYIDDFDFENSNGESVLTACINNNRRFVKEILSRGGKVCYKDIVSVLRRDDLGTFKAIWKHLSVSEFDYFDLMDLFKNKMRRYETLQYIDTILKNSDDAVLAKVADCFTLQKDFNHFFGVFYEGDMEEFTQFICVLLQYNCTFYDIVVYDVFLYCGYEDLFKCFLYMDQIEYTKTCDLKKIMPKYILDIKSDIKSICKDENFNWALPKYYKGIILHLVEFTIDRSLIEALRSHYSNNKIILRICDMVPTIPSLLELARNQTRVYIVNRFNFSTSSQYYTFINDMNISKVYKEILKWEKPLYGYKL